MKLNRKPDGAYKISACDHNGFNLVCNSSPQSVYQHEAWSVAFVWGEDLSGLLGQHRSLIFIIHFSALIFLFLTFALGVMCYGGRCQINGKHLNVFVR